MLAGLGCGTKTWVGFRVHEISAIHVRAIDEQGFDMIVRAKVENPNPVGATVSDIRFRAIVGEAGATHVLGYGSVPGVVTAAARSVFEVQALVRVRYADLPADLPARVADGYLPMIVHADLIADTQLGRFAMQLSADGRTALDDGIDVMIQGGLGAPVVRVTKLEAVGVSLRSLRLRVRVAVFNAFAFPIQVRQGDIDLYLGGRRVGSTVFSQPFQAHPKAQTEREFEITVTHGDMWRTARSLADGKLAIRARGTLWIEPIGGVSHVPFDVLTDLSVIESL